MTSECWADMPSADSSAYSSCSESDDWIKMPTRKERKQMREQHEATRTVYRQEARRLTKRIRQSLKDTTLATYDCVIGLGVEYAYRVQQRHGDLSKMARAMCSSAAAELECRGYALRRLEPVLFPGQAATGACETVGFTSNALLCRLVYVRIDMC